MGNGPKAGGKMRHNKESDTVMITAEELVIELNSSEEKQSCFKLGTVVDLFDNNTAKVQFDGEDTPSEKQYAYLDSYIPGVGDRVLLGVLSGTYVILGKVNYNISPSIEEEVDRYLFDLKKVIMHKGLNVTGGIDADSVITDNLTVDGNIGVSGNVMATGISSSGNISGANITTGTRSRCNTLESVSVMESYY